MSSFESVRGEIAAVQRRLDEVPSDSFLKRIDLRDRLNELRAEAAALCMGAEPEGPSGELLARLANLKRRRAEARGARSNAVKQGSLFFTTPLNREIDRGLGVADLDEQTAALEQILSDRGVEPD